MSTDSVPDQLPDGRTVQKVPVKPPIPVAQAFTRISQLTNLIDHAKSISEAQAFAYQLSSTTLKSARELTKYAEEHEPKTHLLYVVEEMEVLSAMAAQLHSVIKAHSRPTDKNAKIRGNALIELSKAVRTVGEALHEYLLALGDIQAPTETPPP